MDNDDSDAHTFDQHGNLNTPSPPAQYDEHYSFDAKLSSSSSANSSSTLAAENQPEMVLASVDSMLSTPLASVGERPSGKHETA